MKIVFVITDYGSFNNFLGEVAVELLKNKHDVYLICSPLKIINCEDKFPYQDLGLKIFYSSFPRNYNFIKQFRSSRTIHEKLKAINPDIVNIHFTTAMLTTLLYKKPEYFTLGTFHGLGYPTIDNKIKSNIFQIIEYFSCRRLDQIWTINNFDYQLLNKRFPFKVNLIRSKGLGCDLAKFNPELFNIEQKRVVRTTLGIKENEFVIMYTGRFVDFKGFHLVIRSLPFLNDVKLILVGGKDPIHPTGLNKEEEKLLERNSIINIGFSDSVEKYLSISDLFIFPSKKEGIPVCIIEALAMGIPVITLDARGCNDLIIDGYNGILLSKNSSPKDIANEVTKIKNDNKLLEFFRCNIIKDRFLYDRKVFVEDQLNILCNIF